MPLRAEPLLYNHDRPVHVESIFVTVPWRKPLSEIAFHSPTLRQLRLALFAIFQRYANSWFDNENQP